MKTKALFLILLLSCLGSLFAESSLGMFVEAKRYLGSDGSTEFVIDYQVPYKNLMFMTRDKIFYAELKVTLKISKADSVVASQDFTNNIGVTRKYDVTTSSKSYPDRIAFNLSAPGYSFSLDFRDVNSDRTYQWQHDAELLSPDEKLSDIELITTESADTLLYSGKFNRQGRFQLPESSGVVSREMTDSVFFYCEAYNLATSRSRAVLTVLRGEEPVLIKTYTLTNAVRKQPLLFPVNISSFDTGAYTAIIELTDDETTYSRAYDLIVNEQAEQLFFIFTDVEDEYSLIRYIANPRSSVSWKSMSLEAKRRYISNFWLSVAAMSGIPVEEIMKKYRDRIDYSNARFSHFEKGWKSDMGRIYIRNGPPSDVEGDVESLTSSDETRYVRKDYQIWKYSGLNKGVYLFVDNQFSGNFKLVYVSNDERESTFPDWRKYVGSDFDETRLEN